MTSRREAPALHKRGEPPRSTIPTMARRKNLLEASLLLYALLISPQSTESFAPAIQRRSIQHRPHGVTGVTGQSTRRTSLRKHELLRMSSDDEGGPGTLTAIFASCVLLYFAASALAPLVGSIATQTTTGDLSSSVVTRQDASKDKRQSKFDVVSTQRIQQKLRNIPVFYLSDGTITATLDERLYMSYHDAELSRKDGEIVKATTMDQVLYPLILKKDEVVNIKSLGDTPSEVLKAIEARDSKQYQLLPSKAAIEDARATNTVLQPNDLPLFKVDRLAFASNEGPQVPLFTERQDAITSYKRLQEGSSTLPPEPVVKSTSLFDVVESMELGSRPGVGQLAFYANADDVQEADKLTAE